MDPQFYTWFIRLLNDLSSEHIGASAAIPVAIVACTAGVLAAFKGLKVVKLLCIVAAAGPSLALAIPIARELGAAASWGWIGGGLLAIVLGAVAYRLVIGLSIVLTLLLAGGLSVAGFYHDQIDWNRLTDLAVTTAVDPGFISEAPDGMARASAFAGRAREQYSELVEQQPALPWVLGLAAAAALVLATLLAMWAWRLAAALIAATLGVQLVLIGGSLLALQAGDAALEWIARNLGWLSAGLAVAAVVLTLRQLITRRRPATEMAPER